MFRNDRGSLAEPEKIVMSFASDVSAHGVPVAPTPTSYAGMEAQNGWRLYVGGVCY
ncbi:hypothetical protein [Rhodococcus koreensis]|uniref:hypothetical protein n=1 Tax=Rhodococcus koreensis TaxID=99653 RepID=UPI001981103D|nr:hypothetical protein [Rhodococcus koreensis]QSE86735.1 hypothetical protein JWS14_47630 [Rhodococcus koreensis]